MSLTLEEFLAEYPVNRELVEAHKKRLWAEIRAINYARFVRLPV